MDNIKLEDLGVVDDETPTNSYNLEIQAMYAIAKAFDPLDIVARARVLSWAISRFAKETDNG